jgi:repressor LexA
MAEAVRPTKKQRELLSFIEAFIGEHGYSPSYREIMSGLDYTSVATVALHVNSLITRGHLRKRENSARSLEIVKPADTVKIKTSEVDPGQEKWLIEKVEHMFSQAEALGNVMTQNVFDELYVVVGALKILGFDGAAQSFLPRLGNLKKKLETD